MARQSPAQLRIQRVERYRALRAELQQDREVNASQMATVLGMTRPNLKKLMDGSPDFPVLHTGINGQEYRMSIAAVLDWAIGHYAAKAGLIEARRDAVDELARQAPQGDPIDAPDMGQVARFVDASVKLTRAQQMQGKLVEKALVDQLAQGFVLEVSEFLIGLPAKLDPTGRMDIALRQDIEAACRGQMVVLSDRLGAWLKNVEPD